jgi:hypothetical protein
MTTMSKFIGYHDISTLPVKVGDYVLIRRGTQIHSTNPRKRDREAQVSYVVKVASLGSGATINHKDFPYVCPVDESTITYINPSVCWVGAHGYWCEADIKLVPSEKRVA